MQPGSPNLTQEYSTMSTMSPENQFILGSEGQTSRSRGTKIAGVGLGTLVSAGFF